jgi:hypothetical protein
MCKKYLAVAAGAAVLVGIAVPTAALASGADGRPGDRGCAQAFDEAVHEDMDSFNARDMDRYSRILTEQLIDNNNGTVTTGRDAVLANAAKLFAVNTWTFPYTVRQESVYGCRAGIVIIDANWLVPSKNIDLRMVISMTLVHEHGRWLVANDNTTTLPAA